MLIRRHDEALNDGEWQQFLEDHDFGQFIAAGAGREVPVVVPTHFVFTSPNFVHLHLAKDNPIFDALSENPIAIMSVTGAYEYIPTTVNAGPAEPAEYGVPTSYYGAVQLTGAVTFPDDVGLAAILNAQLGHFQPEGGHAIVSPGYNPYGRQFKGIRGLILEVNSVRAKFKFGNNKTVEHRIAIAEWLATHDSDNAAEARDHLLRRLAEQSRDDNEH